MNRHSDIFHSWIEDGLQVFWLFFVQMRGTDFCQELLNLRLPEAETHASMYFNSHELWKQFSPEVTFPRFCQDYTEVMYMTFR
jgi:hypothetical protein